MSKKLHLQAVEQAERLIKANEVATFDKDWKEEQPTPDEINHYIDSHFMTEYGKWFLGIDAKFPKEVKEHYDYPYGDLKVVQRSALVDTIKRAEKNGDSDIVHAAKRLLELVDKKVK